MKRLSFVDRISCNDNFHADLGGRGHDLHAHHHDERTERLRRKRHRNVDAGRRRRPGRHRTQRRPATTPQPAHIHTGTCAKLGGVVYPLSNVVDGASTSTVKGVTIDKLLTATHAINVHESAANLDKYVACGNIE